MTQVSVYYLLIFKMNERNRFEVESPTRYGLKQISIATALTLMPSLIAGFLLGAGSAGLLVAIILAVCFGTPYWLILIPVGCLILNLTMFYFAPSLFFANYYIKWLVSKLRPADSETGYICQLATLPRSCTGIRAFLDDADDVGILQVRDDRVEFKGHQTSLTVIHSSAISVELLNIGWRGFWFAGRRIRILLHGHEELQAIEIVERQTRTVTEARELALRLFQAIEETMKAT